MIQLVAGQKKSTLETNLKTKKSNVAASRLGITIYILLKITFNSTMQYKTLQHPQ